MSDAFRDAQLLADALLGDDRDARLAEYERRRNEAAGPFHAYTRFLTRLSPLSPRARRLLAWCRHDQRFVDRQIGMLCGSVIPDKPGLPLLLKTGLAAVRGATQVASRRILSRAG
jgi:hypothetical protein